MLSIVLRGPLPKERRKKAFALLTKLDGGGGVCAVEVVAMLLLPALGSCEFVE